MTLPDLQAAIAAGDPALVTRVLAPLGERQRTRLWPEVERIIFDEWRAGWNNRRHDDALAVAFAWTAPGNRVLAEWWPRVPGRRRVTATVDVLEVRRPQWLHRVDLLGTGWLLHHRLYRRGCIPKGDAAAYAAGLARMMARWAATAGDPLREEIARDPGLIDEFFGCFEYDEAGAALHLFDPGQRPTGGERGGAHRAGTLSCKIRELANEGVIGRDRLLTAALDALARDSTWPRLTWYALLVDRLEPTLDEIDEHQGRYRRLLSSVQSPVIGYGHAALRRLLEAGRLDVAAFLNASGPLYRREKRPAVDYLAMVQLVIAEPRWRDRAARVVAAAFGHPRPDVQQRALQLIESVLGDLEPRTVAELRVAAEACSPSVRSAAGGLLEVAVRAKPAVRSAPPASEDPDPVAPVQPLNDEDVTAALLALLGRQPVDPLTLDLALDGMLRRAGRPPDENARAHAAAITRARRTGSTAPVLHSVVASVVMQFGGAAHPFEDPAVRFTRWQPRDLNLRRIIECFFRLRAGRTSLLLSLPTTPLGLLEAEELERRWATMPAEDRALADLDRSVARLRTGTSLPGGGVALRGTGWDDPERYTGPGFSWPGDGDGPGVLPGTWFRLFSANVEQGLGLAMPRLAYEVDISDYLGGGGLVAVSEWLLALGTIAGPAADAALALALAAKEETARLRAVETVVALWSAGLLRPGELAATAAAQVTAGVTKPSRLSVALEEIRRTHPALARDVSLALAGRLAAHRDVGRLLTVAVDAVAEAGPAAMPASLVALAERRSSSKASGEARRLLRSVGH